MVAGATAGESARDQVATIDHGTQTGVIELHQEKSSDEVAKRELAGLVAQGLVVEAGKERRGRQLFQLVDVGQPPAGPATAPASTAIGRLLAHRVRRPLGRPAWVTDTIKPNRVVAGMKLSLAKAGDDSSAGAKHCAEVSAP